MLPGTQRAIGLALACASLLAPRAASTDARARLVAQAPDTGPVLATLAELDADPVSYLGRQVRVRLQLEVELANWNPYLTRFGTADYRSWRAWGDEQFLWRTNEWEHPLGTLFVRRGDALADLLARAPKYARFEVLGRVRQVFMGRAWIELERVERLTEEVDEASLVHASRAGMLIDNERWPLAMEELDRALAGNLPQRARDELWRLRAECREHSPR